MNQTAHISLQLSNNVKEQTSKTQKQTVAQILQRHRLHPTMNAPVYPERLNRLSGPSSPVASASPRWLSVPSGVSQQRLSAAGEGGSKHNLRCPQPLFCKTVIFSSKSNKTPCFHRDKLLRDLAAALIPHEIPAFSPTNPALSVESRSGAKRFRCAQARRGTRSFSLSSKRRLIPPK